MAFTAGVATASMTLYQATGISTTLTATQGTITGTSVGFAVNSAGVALSYSPSCSPITVAKNSTTTFTILVPNDLYSNPFQENSGHGYRPYAGATGAGFTFGAPLSGTAGSVSITSGPANNTFSLVAPSSNKSATLTAAAPPTGFTAPAACTISTS